MLPKIELVPLASLRLVANVPTFDPSFEQGIAPHVTLSSLAPRKRLLLWRYLRELMPSRPLLVSTQRGSNARTSHALCSSLPAVATQCGRRSLLAVSHSRSDWSDV